MRKICYMLSALWLSLAPIGAQETSKTVVIKTNVGTMKAILYDDVPNHTRVFVERARRGDFNGTLFTRVIPEFMIQGGAPDSRNAPAGAGAFCRAAESLAAPASAGAACIFFRVRGGAVTAPPRWPGSGAGEAAERILRTRCTAGTAGSAG